MHQCAMIFNQEWWDIKVCMRNSQIFKAEKAFQLKMPFLSDMSIWQEMAMCQNWTNQFIFWSESFLSQKLFLCQKWLFNRNWLFPPKSAFQSELAFRPEMAFQPEMWYFARNSFLAVLAVQQKLHFGQKYFCRSGFLARNVFFK